LEVPILQKSYLYNVLVSQKNMENIPDAIDIIHYSF